MAILESINYQPMVYSPESEGAEYGWIEDSSREMVKGFPYLFYSDHTPWGEANQYAFHRYFDLQRDLKTVRLEMSHICTYLNWLEKEELHWLHFPKRKSERCLYRYRGYLIDLRDNGFITPSTATSKMNVLVTFYKWASSFLNIGERSEFFDDKVKVVSFYDKTGFSRTMDVATTDLAISNRVRSGVTLEDGVTPITKKNSEILLDHLFKGVNKELYLMVKVALQTGCRQETVATLTINGLEQCYPDYHSPNLMRVKVGPGTGIKTKYDVSGDIIFPVNLVNELKEFYYSDNSTLRRLRASYELHQKIFLTKQGNIYSTNVFAMLIFRLRESLVSLGHTQFGNFKFHQLRATFGTLIMKGLLKRRTQLNAIQYVKELMLHKDSSTTWKYIKFLEQDKIADQFDEIMWSLITGNNNESDRIIDQLVRGESDNG